MIAQNVLGGDRVERPSRTEKRIALSLFALFFADLIYLLSGPFRSHVFWMYFTEDDFFYYLKISQNIASGHGSTFNGIVATNGYHPLYEVLLILLSMKTHRPAYILLFQATLTFLAAASTFILSVHLIRRSHLRLVSSVALGTWFTLYALRTMYYGMEATLTIPLALALLDLALNPSFWRRSWRHAFLIGLLSSVVVLSRLDAIFLVCLIYLGASWSRRLRAQIAFPIVLGVVAGWLPLVFYFLFNHHFFGVWLPISGLAKQLKPNLYPAGRVWHDLYWFIPSYFLVMLPIPVSIISIFFISKKLTQLETGIYMAALWSPWVYYSVISCRSDWPIWPWYMYALRPAVCMSFVVLCTFKPIRTLLEFPAVPTFLLFVFFTYLFISKWPIQQPSLYDASRDIQQFENTHPGIYAMGDRSGSVGYLINSPLVQTEGLVMDKAFLENIKNERPLLDVLKSYHVRYYVGTLLPDYHLDSHGCFHAEEPFNGGPSSPKMRALLCQNPLLSVNHIGTQTLIYDIQSDTPANRTIPSGSK